MRTARNRHLGQPLNLPAPTMPACPPGYHWETPPAVLQGMGACVPDRVVAVRVPRPPPPPATPAVRVVPIRVPGPALQPAGPVVTTAPPSVTVTAAEPSSDQPIPDVPTVEPVGPAPMTCVSTQWPWWYYAIALALGAGAGWWVKGNKKTTKRVANAAAGRIVNRAGDLVLGRILA